MNNFDTIREALTAAANLIAYQYTGTSLGMTALQGASDDCLEALTALAAIKADHYSAADMVSAAAQGYRDGVASVQGEPPGYVLMPKSMTKAMEYVTEQKDWTWEDLLAAAPVAQQQAVPDAMKVVLDAMRSDPGYAWGWHCNVAMAFVDAGGDHYTANQGAARFMRLLAGVEPAHELPEAPQQAEAVRPCTCHSDDNPPVPCAKQYALSECKAQPQAEAVPDVTDAMALAFHHALTDGAIGQSEVEEIKIGLRAALESQQAEAVPSDVVRDAERYQWLRATENANHDAWNQFGPYSSPLEIDAAIDAAIAQQKGQP